MKYIASLILIAVMTVYSRGSKLKSMLIHAQEYEVVDDIRIDLKVKNRTGRMFSIVSKAQTTDELAQTCILAAYELNKAYGYDLTSVMLYPNKDLIRTGTYYAQVEYASDNKGIQGLSGVDKTLFTSGNWKVKVADHTLSDQDLSILNLWYENQNKFPNENLHSSLSFNQDSLVSYIAEELKIDRTKVKLPHIVCKDYKGVDLKNWMTPKPH